MESEGSESSQTQVIFEGKPTGFPGRSEVEGERKRGVRNDTQGFDPSI